MDGGKQAADPCADAAPIAAALPPPTVGTRLLATWGVLTVSLLLTQASIRLGILALEPWLQGTMTPLQIAIYIAWVLANGYMEGYRAFQKQWCPRVVQRAFHLGRNPRLLHVILAPFFCMSLFHTTRRRLIVSWTLVTAIICAILLLRLVPQPWRGIVDGGVVVGLVWGLVALWIFFLRWFRNGAPPPPDLPAARPA